MSAALRAGYAHAGAPRAPWRLVPALFIFFISVGASQGATNLVVNGGFETADPARPGVPLGWERPDGLGVQWTNAPAGHGLAIRLDTRISEREMNASWARAGLTNDWFIPNAAGNAIAEVYGLSYYSRPFAVASGVTYRVTCDVLGPSGAKVWVRGYGLFRGQMAHRYEVVMICYGGGDAWRTCTLEFNPTRHRPEVTEMKVMLYAYYPAGVYWFDNVRVEAIEGIETRGQKSETRSQRSEGRSQRP